MSLLLSDFFSPAVDPGNMCESALVGSAGLYVVTWGEDIGPNAYNRCAFMVHRCTHQCTRSLWQVCYPCSVGARQNLISIQFCFVWNTFSNRWMETLPQTWVSVSMSTCSIIKTEKDLWSNNIVHEIYLLPPMLAKYAANNHQSVSCDEYLRQIRRKRRIISMSTWAPGGLW